MLSSADLTLLSRLDLVHRRSQVGATGGRRRSPRSARSPEFADFRAYVRGDDFRQIDWKAYARLDRLMVRLYMAEEESCLNLVIDASASMALGSTTKWERARSLAAALCVLGLAAMDRVSIGILSDPLPPRGGGWVGGIRGRESLGRVISFLSKIEPAGTAGPGQLRELGWLRPGLTVVISDFLVEGNWSRPLAWLRKQRQEPLLWQVLAPEEADPPLRGDYRLVDAESDWAEELTITSGLVAEYREALATHRSDLRRAAEAAGGRFLHVLSSDDLSTAMTAGIRAGAIRRD